MNAPCDTLAALGGNPMTKLHSRALGLTRFACPELKEEGRNAFFTNALSRSPVTQPNPLATWLNWLETGLGLDRKNLVFGKLQGRLVLHLSGGVMENASILLDRFGYPYLPGSGVKGIARRAALHALRTWCVEGKGQKPTDSAESATELCAEFSSPVEMAERILQTFGWADGEWKDGRKPTRKGLKGSLHSDLEWAMGEGQSWREDRARLAEKIAQWPGIQVDHDRPRQNFAGRACFLSAKPVEFGYPKNGRDLELDVVTCHHREYYSGKKPVALDNEEPNPVVFPTVAAGITFVFAVQARDPDVAKFARACLRLALTTFGAGAKTATGYGWFEDVTREVEERENAAAQKRREAEAKTAEEKRRADELATRKAREAALAAMTPEQRADDELAQIVENRGSLKLHLARFADQKKPLSDPQKTAILRWLAAEGQGRDLWLNEIKTGQGKSKDRDVWKRIVGPIHAAKKTLKIDLP